MNKLSLFIVLFLLLIYSNKLLSQQANQKSVAVTVYNVNLGVVKDVRTIDLKSGRSQIAITDVAQFIDPTSVHIKLNGKVLEQNYKYDIVSINKNIKK